MVFHGSFPQRIFRIDDLGLWIPLEGLFFVLMEAKWMAFWKTLPDLQEFQKNKQITNLDDR